MTSADTYLCWGPGVDPTSSSALQSGWGPASLGQADQSTKLSVLHPYLHFRQL